MKTLIFAGKNTVRFENVKNLFGRKFSFLCRKIVILPFVFAVCAGFAFAQYNGTSQSALSENFSAGNSADNSEKPMENEQNILKESAEITESSEISDSGEKKEISEKSENPGESEESEKVEEAESKKRVSVVPKPKRPKKPDSEKVKQAELKDTDKDSAEDKRDALKYGIESDIITLLKKLSDNDDPRFVDEIYDLFQTSKSPRFKTAILDYFAKLEDPCLEDYAVTVLNDPYDEPLDLVSSVFSYAAKVKCHEAVPAVMNLLENDNEKYFNSALDAIGDIGGEEEAEEMAGYLDREDLTSAQRQSLMRVLGKLKAVKTWDKLKEIVENEDENIFVRAYAAQAIGAMQKIESVEILKNLFEDSDPTLRTYALKGLSYFDKEQVQDIFLEGLRDSYYKVRLEAIEAVEKLEIKDAVSAVIYRAKTDPESAVKKACYPVLAKFNTKETDEFLFGIIKNKKSGDNTRALVVEALMKHKKAVPSEIVELAEQTAKDDLSKSLRYAIGKQFVKYANLEYGRAEFAGVCKLYLESKDVSTQGMGLDLYAAGRYGSCDSIVHEIAESSRPSVNKTKARRILKLPVEDEEKKSGKQNK